MLTAKTFDGAPCKRGHGTKRYTCSNTCVTCAKARAVAHTVAHREEKRAYLAAYYDEHRDVARVRAATYYEVHGSEIRARIRAHNAAHPENVRMDSAMDRAQKLLQRCTCCTNKQIRSVYDIASLCGRGAQIDHRVPLALGGHHCVKNLQAMTVEDHREKTKRDHRAISWAKRRSKLLQHWPVHEGSM